MPFLPDHALLAIAPAFAVKIPLNGYTIVFLVAGLAFAGWLAVIAMFYGRKPERPSTDEPGQVTPAGASTRPDDR